MLLESIETSQNGYNLFIASKLQNRYIIGEYKLENKLKILGFAGSLRAGSYNKALLRAAIDLLPEGVTLEIFDLLGIPAYNQDLESDMPTKVKEFKSKIREESDAILIATPEYNFSVPGVLKNAIDWHQDHTVIIHLMVNQSLS